MMGSLDEQRIDSMLRILREMKADMKRSSKISAIDYRDSTPRQCQKRKADANWIGMAQIKRRHELHALAVELGFAERREHYSTFELTDGWHRYNHTPREPN